jgi:hypothetical protein
VNLILRTKLLGTLLITVAVLGIIYFTLVIPVDLFLNEMGPGFMANPGFLVPFLPGDIFDWRWGVAIPVYAAIVVVCGILIWVGSKMVTTPRPQPDQLVEREEGLES